MKYSGSKHRPTRETFERVAAWCERSLAGQHGENVGHPFGELVRSLAAIAEISSDPTTDRFEQRKAVETRVDDLLIELAAAHSACLQGRLLARPAGVQSPSGDRSQGTDLFVYGTLKRGFSRTLAMRGQLFAGEALTAPKYRMYDCGSYPGIVESPGDGLSIQGEVWKVDGACLARLDEIEGVPLNLYARRKIELLPPFDQRDVECYFYQRCTFGLADCETAWTLA